LVLDATYEYFVQAQQQQDDNSSNNNSRTTTIAPAFDEPHCIHIFSLSKAYALAGYRCGYVAVHREACNVLWGQLLKVQDTIPIAPSRVAQVAAMGALEAGRAWVQDRIATLEAGRTALRQVLKDHLLTVVGGDGAIYLWAKLPPSDSEDENGVMNDVQVAERLVRDYGVALIPGSFCGVPGWIRVCYANLPPEKSVKAAQRLARGLREIVGKIRT
jgi:aspartate/methionine/tyrosine aminotransferase